MRKYVSEHYGLFCSDILTGLAGQYNEREKQPDRLFSKAKFSSSEGWAELQPNKTRACLATTLVQFVKSYVKAAAIGDLKMESAPSPAPSPSPSPAPQGWD